MQILISLVQKYLNYNDLYIKITFSTTLKTLNVIKVLSRAVYDFKKYLFLMCLLKLYKMI